MTNHNRTDGCRVTLPMPTHLATPITHLCIDPRPCEIHNKCDECCPVIGCDECGPCLIHQPADNH